ncbi:ectonucleotide pyrophosphatase/phosphodiesterase family member 5-like isoform X2 [Aethina tumida]|uniref:ectonucleotide pyrophosphatase/phosphodiesterase family member 5-like isoform X2 n=1 Tax=Aethina tumida TaxID=116153 RepID=UPI00214738A4|nr:ectonucleotide pyrophosphatase/phosphodiesterase family member 5-like isoform X2 [Aethina tumida]
MIFKILLQCLFVSFVYSISQHPILIIVSYDAFRHDFFETQMVPYMEKLKKTGASVDYVKNVFPTKTFPNHHSIATGLLPDVHGIIGNTYYDRDLKKAMNMSYEMYHYNNNIVPIWRLNEDMGEGRHSASMMWPGAAYAYQNKNITHVQPYNTSIDWHERIDKVISWITHPTHPANLVMVYFEEPDTHGHAYGPNSPVIMDLLQKLDNLTKYLDDKIKEHNLENTVNVIHLSDHGLTAVTPLEFVNVTQYLTQGTYITEGASPCMQIIAKEGHLDEIYEKLSQASKKVGKFKILTKENFTQYHYLTSRSPDILVLANEGYALDDMILAAPRYAAHYNFTLTNETEFGVHGYFSQLSKDMYPFFMARGPRFKQNYRKETVNTVDFFNLFSHVLGIEPTLNNGTWEHVEDFLVPASKSKYSLTSILVVTEFWPLQ